ncbi:hypothetical protein ALC60_10971 [Trachymyrmex zeteki]|uniref:Uncharacterized protein n=1 Tax=Mycetomoellerius zeteki TaxID=64791 RepID=A0A151WQ35_9HYME|nr:hypothetical protein ALC60_10971 [Trachymyrmex zeteki]
MRSRFHPEARSRRCRVYKEDKKVLRWKAISFGNIPEACTPDEHVESTRGTYGFVRVQNRHSFIFRHYTDIYNKDIYDSPDQRCKVRASRSMHTTFAVFPSPSLSVHSAKLAIGETRNCSPFAGVRGCKQEKYCYSFAIRWADDGHWRTWPVDVYGINSALVTTPVNWLDTCN